MNEIVIETRIRVCPCGELHPRYGVASRLCFTCYVASRLFELEVAE